MQTLKNDKNLFFIFFIKILKVCGIARCIDDLICILPDPLLRKVWTTDVTFTEMKITASFEGDVNVYPLAANNEGQILEKSSLIYEKTNSLYSFSLNSTSMPLIDLTMYGAIWDKNHTLSF